MSIMGGLIKFGMGDAHGSWRGRSLSMIRGSYAPGHVWQHVAQCMPQDAPLVAVLSGPPEVE